MDNIETYKAVFNSSPDGLIVADERGKILLVNNQIEKLFGYTKDELIDQEIELLIPNRYKHKHVEYRANYSVNPSAREMGAQKELWACRKDGVEFAVEISLSPIKLKDRVIFSAAIRDATERRKAEMEIASQNKILHFQNTELEQFAYITSHDLQEPLRSLISFTDLLEEEYADKLDTDAKTYIEFISKSSKRMQELVKGLLDYSRIGKERELVQLDCNQIVNEVLLDMTVSIREKKAEINVEPLPKINGYYLEIRQLFQNLISNALKFTAKDIPPKIKIAGNNQGNEWAFTIQDNGIGISEEDKPKVFTIFKRLHNRNEYEGSGIGLAHCKKIVSLHGGNIWVDSKIGEGSVFNFTIHKY